MTKKNMKMKNKLFPVLVMHFGFLFYSFYTVLGKIASRYDFLSIKWLFLYCILIFILAIYALLWQQVLKHIALSVAMANKAITIVWGLIWSILIFKDTISLLQIFGAVVIVVGIVVLAVAEKKNQKEAEANAK